MKTSNALTLTTDQAAKLAKAVEAVVGDGFSGFDYLKCAKGKWMLREDVVKPDDTFLVHCESWSYGGVKFIDGKPVDRRVGRAIDGFQMPDQDDLPERDAKSWPKINGIVKDPWTLQSYLVLENVRTGELVLLLHRIEGWPHGNRQVDADSDDESASRQSDREARLIQLSAQRLR
jgi:hypothetical protein